MKFHFSILFLCLILVFSRNVYSIGLTTRVLFCPNCGNLLGGVNIAPPSLSIDGRYLAYDSSSIAFDGPFTYMISQGISIFDRITQQTKIVSVNSKGELGNEWSFDPSISASGHLIAFVSQANNLAPNDNDLIEDIYIHDQFSGETTLMSVNSAGSKGNSLSYSPSISANGRFVAFESLSDNLVDNDKNSQSDIFIRDTQTNETTRISLGPNQIEMNGGSFNPSVNSDGRFIAFSSDATNVVPGDNNLGTDIFVRDRILQQTTILSVDASGVPGNRHSYFPAIGASGRFVAFVSDASNLIQNDTNGKSDIFVHDRLTKRIERISVNSIGEQGNDNSGVNDLGVYSAPAISASGRFIVFTSTASNLVDGDTNNESDVFLHDRQTKTTTRISVNSSGQQSNTLSFMPAISGTGYSVAFKAYDGNLVAGDNNIQIDYFNRDWALNTSLKANLAISVTSKPDAIVKNNQGNFVFTIINQGAEIIKGVKIQHILSNGKMVTLTPERGTCYRYSSISLCNIPDLPPGGKVTLQAGIKATDNALSQHIIVSNPYRVDVNGVDNYLDVSTTVVE